MKKTLAIILSIVCLIFAVGCSDGMKMDRKNQKEITKTENKKAW